MELLEGCAIRWRRGMVGSIPFEVSTTPCPAITQLTFGQSNAQTHHYSGLSVFMIITTPMPTHDTQSLATPTCIHTTHGIHLLVPNYMDLTSLLLLDAGYRYGLFLCYGLFSVALSFLSDTRCLVVGFAHYAWRTAWSAKYVGHLRINYTMSLDTEPVCSFMWYRVKNADTGVRLLKTIVHSGNYTILGQFIREFIHDTYTSHMESHIKSLHN